MKRAIVWLSALIVLCSGCGQKAAPLILDLPDCPAPMPPVLPMIDGAESLDSPANIARIMNRDDLIREYIDGLNAALGCYQARRRHGSD